MGLVSIVEAVLRGLGLASREESMFLHEHLSCSVIPEHLIREMRT